MRAVIVTRSAAGSHQLNWGAAFAKGLKKHGWTVEITTDEKPCDLLCMWGVRRTDRIERQKRGGGQVCILERGYVGDRHEWTSVSFGGGLNKRGEFRGPLEDASRWNKHHAELMQPWREKRDGVALLIGQVPGDNSIRNVDIDRWYRQATEAMQCRGYNVKFRPHPMACRGHNKPVPLAKDLDGASVVVSFNSNTAVEAVLAGVPSIAMDRGSMAWDVTGHEFGKPPTPEREKWAHWLAWTQYTKSEMETGYAWECISQTVPA